jgi:hypothetical protein
MAESDCFMIVFVARWGMEKPFSYVVMLFCTLRVPLFLCDEARAVLISFYLYITAKYMFSPLSFLPFEQVFGAEL